MNAIPMNRQNTGTERKPSGLLTLEETINVLGHITAAVNILEHAIREYMDSGRPSHRNSKGQKGGAR